MKTTEVRVDKKMESVAQVLSKWMGVTKRCEDKMGKKWYICIMLALLPIYLTNVVWKLNIGKPFTL